VAIRYIETAKHRLILVIGGILAGRTSDPYTARGRVESLNAAFSFAPISLKSVSVMITAPHALSELLPNLVSNIPSFNSSVVSSKSETGIANVNMFVGIFFSTFARVARFAYQSIARGYNAVAN
jgi:hypothetical protein